MAAKHYELKQGKKVVVIPARMASERLPGKPMLEAAGKPLVRWTYDRAKQTDADHVIVATADLEITAYCMRNNMIWMKTAEHHPNGTSRVAEVFGKLKPEVRREVSTVVNWQVDEPLVEPSDVNVLMATRVSAIGTLVCPDDGKMEARSWALSNPNRTKTVWSNGKCHWFSRVPMRGCGIHVGLYSFTPFLLQAASMLRPSRLAEEESLEQLTWLEAGFVLAAVEIERLPLSINTPEDWGKFKWLKEREN